MAELREKKSFCINCDNKHGCKSGTPPCIAEMEKDRVKGIKGKQYLIKIKKIYRCENCLFFRSCWNIEDYRKMADNQP